MDWFVEPTMGNRLLARILDTLVLSPAIIVGLVLGDNAMGAAVPLMVEAAYETLMVATRGTTIGKRAMKLRVATMHAGERPTLEQSFLRWLIPSVGGIASIFVAAAADWDLLYTVVVLLPILQRPYHRGIHDHGAGTVVTATASRT